MRRVRGVAAIALASGLAWDVQPPPRVWCVGDSITHFYVPALVRLEPTWTVLDLGRGAERSDHGLVRLLGLLAENPPPEVVVLLFGANDVGARVLEGDREHGPAEAAANIHRMALLVRGAGAIPIVGLPVGTPPASDEDAPEARVRLRALRRGFAALRAALRADRPQADVRLPRRALFLDALHPRPAGVERIARRVAAAVRRVTR